MNPILHKELRTMLRERRGWLVPMVYAAGLAGAVSIMLVPQLMTQGFDQARWTGRFLVGMVAVVQAIALVIFAPLVGAATVAGERERATWLSLMASAVPRHQVASGKVIASGLYVLLLMSVSAPIAAVALPLGAIDLPTLAGLYLTHAVVGGTLACVGVWTSTLFHRTWTAALAAIALAFALAAPTAALTTSAAAMDSMLPDRDLSVLYRWILCFNPFYGLYLFLAGDPRPDALLDWWGHFGAMGLLAAAAVAAATLRLRRLRE